MSRTISIVAAGDFIAQKKLPGEYEGFLELKNFINRADARFINFELSTPDERCFGNQFFGGTYLRAHPEALDEVKEFGFNMLSFAHNHTLDYSYRGLLLTLKNVQKHGFINAGVGKNLDEASAPGFLETLNGRVGLVGAVSTMVNEAAIAGRQSRRVIGRPGVNGIRINEHLLVTSDQLRVIREIAEESSINARDDIMRAEGWIPEIEEGTFALKNLRFKLNGNNKAEYSRHVNTADMQRVQKSIEEALMSSDAAIVSIHSHELTGKSKENPADFIVEFAHNCIDAGASAVIGHGPHLLRPMEIYKNCPIFYSLGNFRFEEEVTPFAPEDLFEVYKLTSDYSMQEMIEKRTNHHQRGLLSDPRFLEAVVPYFEIKDRKLTKIELLPIELGFGLNHWEVGLPRPSYDKGIIERFSQLSKSFGTVIENCNGLGVVGL